MGRAYDPAGTAFGVTQTVTGTANLPGAGLPTSTRSAVTSSPVSRLKETHGFGMRPKTNFWIGWPVAMFIIVAVTPIAALIAAAMGVSSGMRRVSVPAAMQ